MYNKAGEVGLKENESSESSLPQTQWETKSSKTQKDNKTPTSLVFQGGVRTAWLCPQFSQLQFEFQGCWMVDVELDGCLGD